MRNIIFLSISVLLASALLPATAYAASEGDTTVLPGGITATYTKCPVSHCYGIADEATYGNFYWATNGTGGTSLPNPNDIGQLPTDSIQTGADQLATNQLEELTRRGDMLGCAGEGEFGGSVANSLQSALERGLQGLLGQAVGQLSGQAQDFINQIASKAGPLGPLVQKLGSQGLSFLQGKADQLLGSLVNQVSGEVGQALSGVAQALSVDVGSAAAGVLGQGAAGALGGVVGGIAGGVGLGAAVPTTEIGELRSRAISIDQFAKSIDAHQDIIEQTQLNDAYVRCVVNPQIAKTKNALIALGVRNYIDYVNGGGFEGQSAFTTNINARVHGGQQDVVKDIVDNQTAGICSPYRPDVQKLLLLRYQYQDNYGKQSQCNTATAQASQDGAQTRSDLANRAFNIENDGIYQFFVGNQTLKSTQADYTFVEFGNYIKNEGAKDYTRCDDDGQIPPNGYCAGGGYTTSVHGAQIAHALTNKLQLADQQLVEADEMQELVDALSQNLLSVAFQGINGLLGLSQSSGGQGSYLDDLVGQNVNDATNVAGNVLLSDLSGALATESTYLTALDLTIGDLANARTSYTSVIACYKPLTTSGNGTISAAVAAAVVAHASTTITTIIVPELSLLEQDRALSESAINQLAILADRASLALTVQEINDISAAYSALKASGAVHTATDLNYLLTGIESGAVALETLLQDSSIKLAVCQAP